MHIFSQIQAGNIKNTKISYQTTEEVSIRYNEITDAEREVENIVGEFNIIDYIQSLPRVKQKETYESTPVLLLMAANTEFESNLLEPFIDLDDKVITYINEVHSNGMNELINSGLLETSIDNKQFPEELYNKYYEWDETVNPGPPRPASSSKIPKQTKLIEMLFSPNFGPDTWLENLRTLINSLKKLNLDPDQYQCVENLETNQYIIIDMIKFINDLDKILSKLYNNNKNQNNG